MTPDWLHQSLWFVSGVFATGALWYFLSQKNYHATLWSGFGAVVVALLAVALLIRNDLIRRERELPASPPPEARQEPFFLRAHTAMVFAYPGPLVYRYHAKPGQLLAPVGLTAVIEATNKRPTAAKVFSYVVDAPIAGQWVRLHNLQALNPTEFFWINNNNLTTATRLDFSTNSFDIQARERTLSPGESIKGWVFLEWPPELRAQVPTVRELRLTIENSHGEKQTSVLTLPTAEEAGGSIIAGGQWHVVSQQVAADLSQVPIMPHMDLLRAYREGTLK